MLDILQKSAHKIRPAVHYSADTHCFQQDTYDWHAEPTQKLQVDTYELLACTDHLVGEAKGRDTKHYDTFAGSCTFYYPSTRLTAISLILF